MASLKSLKLRIKSVKSTQKITKAMQMVAASKLKRARTKVEAAIPYAEKIAELIGDLTSGLAGSNNTKHPLMKKAADKTYLLLVVTSDRGLCGAFNSSIVKAVKRYIDKLLAEGKQVKIICLGKKGYDLLKGQFIAQIIDSKVGVGAKGLTFNESKAISSQVLKLFEENKFDICKIFYGHFNSVISQEVTIQKLIPFEAAKTSLNSAEKSYEYEPDEDEVLTELLPKNLHLQVYKALLDNAASENGARMNAMDNATRNSGEMIKALSTVYNRSRQAQITKELIEIISGAEAIKG